MSSGHPRRRLRWLTRIATVGSVLVIGFFTWVAVVPFPPEALRRDTLTSTMILDRSGRLLREVLSSDETRGRWTPLAEISPGLVQATIHAEDKRFYDHAGSDFLAIARSLRIAATAGEAKSGASTLTQQTVKLTLQRDEPRTLATKLMEIVWAWRLELSLTKDGILEQYLNRAPYGNQLVGAQAASWMYLGKPVKTLSLAEAAFLAGLPNSPTRLNPYRDLEAAQARQRWILDLMRERGAITSHAWRAAREEPLRLLPRRGARLAPHLSVRLAKTIGALPAGLRPASFETTIDLPLQSGVEQLLAAQQPEDAREGRMQAAAIVLDTRTSEVLAWVGSRDFEDAGALGQNDGVRALRQPGSTLKPFVYAALFDAGAPYDTVFEDRATEFSTPSGPYRPENFDRRYHGPVGVRTALASSLNIPAVSAASRVGVPRLLSLLRELGLGTLRADADHYGLGLALGNGEVRLVDLAGAYATLGRYGRYRPVRWTLDRSREEADVSVLSPESCFVILDMLADDRARGIGFGLAGPFELPFRLAGKTGTSSDFRDNWAVGVTPEHTIAVWVGNFDGRPMQRPPGRSGAAPLVRQIAQLIYGDAADRGAVPWFQPPATLTKTGSEWARR